MALAFAGVAAGLYRPTEGSSYIGNGLAIVAAIAWGATTLVVKATSLRSTDATKVLLYQIGTCALVTPFLAYAAGETWPTHVSAVAALSVVYQSVWVVGVTYLIWFWLLGVYRAADLSAFTFVTPIVGVLVSWLVLGETPTVAFLAAMVLVAAGIALVNWPASVEPRPVKPAA
jgi:drug/metabolite transporter (DMT)-like permease